MVSKDRNKGKIWDLIIGPEAIIQAKSGKETNDGLESWIEDKSEKENSPVEIFGEENLMDTKVGQESPKHINADGKKQGQLRRYRKLQFQQRILLKEIQPDQTKVCNNGKRKNEIREEQDRIMVEYESMQKRGHSNRIQEQLENDKVEEGFPKKSPQEQ